MSAPARVQQVFDLESPRIEGTSWDDDATRVQVHASRAYRQLAREGVLRGDEHLLCVILIPAVGATFTSQALVLAGDLTRTGLPLDGVAELVEASHAAAYLLMAAAPDEDGLICVYSGFDGDRALLWRGDSLIAAVPPRDWCGLGCVRDRPPRWTVGEA